MKKCSLLKLRQLFYHNLKSITYTLLYLLIFSFLPQNFYCTLWNAILNLFTSSPTSLLCLKSSSPLGTIFLSFVTFSSRDWLNLLIFMNHTAQEVGLYFLHFLKNATSRILFPQQPQPLRIHATEVYHHPLFLSHSLSFQVLPVIHRSFFYPKCCFCHEFQCSHG